MKVNLLLFHLIPNKGNGRETMQISLKLDSIIFFVFVLLKDSSAHFFNSNENYLKKYFKLDIKRGSS